MTNFTRILSIAILASALFIQGCSQQTNEQRIQEQITQKVHALGADERLQAQTNAKQFFEKEWPQKKQDGSIGRERGFWNECRPSDSNANGLVTCFGKVPTLGGGFEDVKRYCGYRPELVGCSDEDTVK
jgi:protein involved in sex pheromone biosynthesis